MGSRTVDQGLAVQFMSPFIWLSAGVSTLCFPYKDHGTQDNEGPAKIYWSGGGDQQLSSPVRAAGRNGQADDTYPLSELGVILLQEA